MMDESDMGKCPYVGLRPFSDDDRALFFGREIDVERVVNLIYSNRILVLYAPSGTGKSSMLCAGVMPVLRQVRGAEVRYINDWTEGPATALRTGMDRVKCAEFDCDLLTLFRCQNELTGCRQIVLMDQFEEVSHYAGSLDAIWDQLAPIANDPSAPVCLAFSLRSDFLSLLSGLMDRVPGLLESRYQLSPLSLEAARRAICGPIAEYNRARTNEDRTVDLEPELVEIILNELRSQEEAPGMSSSPRSPSLDLTTSAARNDIPSPYLQMVMWRIWHEEKRERSFVLREETLRRLGGVQAIVRTHLDGIMRSLSRREQVLAASIFRFLVTPSGTRVALTSADLAGYTKQRAETIRSLLNTLSRGDMRIVRALPQTRGAQPTRYEIFHDVLSEPILDWTRRSLRGQELAEHYDRASDIFALTVLHEVHAPLQILSAGLGALAAKQEREDMQGAQVMASKLHDCVERLTRKMDSIRETLQPASKAERFRPSRLESVIREAAAPFTEMAKDRSITIRFSDSLRQLPNVSMDRNLMVLLFSSLIENAVKYSHSGYHVELSGKSGPGWVEINVVDFGLGIAPEDKELIFSRGYRGHAAENEGRHVAGAGIGLTVAQQVAKLHYGEIRVTSHSSDGHLRGSREAQHRESPSKQWMGYVVTFTVHLPIDPIVAGSGM